MSSNPFSLRNFMPAVGGVDSTPPTIPDLPGIPAGSGGGGGGGGGGGSMAKDPTNPFSFKRFVRNIEPGLAGAAEMDPNEELAEFFASLPAAHDDDSTNLFALDDNSSLDELGLSDRSLLLASFPDMYRTGSGSESDGERVQLPDIRQAPANGRLGTNSNAVVVGGGPVVAEFNGVPVVSTNRSDETIHAELSRLIKQNAELQTLAEKQSERIHQLRRENKSLRRSESTETKDLHEMLEKIGRNLSDANSRAEKAERAYEMIRQENGKLRQDIKLADERERKLSTQIDALRASSKDCSSCSRCRQQMNAMSSQAVDMSAHLAALSQEAEVNVQAMVSGLARLKQFSNVLQSFGKILPE